jgi:acyl carrier protein
VAAAALVVRDKGPAGRRLVAYVVKMAGTDSSEEELKGQLRNQLPDYMVPSRIVFLEQLPLTLNGKVDRKALPASEDGVLDQRQYVMPRNQTEERLVGIWREVLGTEKVGISDNFFDLGGHSLRAVQFVSRVREALQIELPLRQVFEAPTVAALAAVLAQEQSQSQVVTPSIAKIARGTGLPPGNLDNLSDSEVDSMLKELLKPAPNEQG